MRLFALPNSAIDRYDRAQLVSPPFDRSWFVQVATSLTIAPPSASVEPSATQQFTATVLDQLGTTMSGASITWAKDGGAGSINSSGLYTAPTTDGSAVISATSGSASQTAAITVRDSTAPSVPTGVTVSYPGSGSRATISWTANPEPDVIGYLIEMTVDGVLSSLTADTPFNGTSYDAEVISIGHLYQFFVTAVDGASPSNYSSASAPATLSTIAGTLGAFATVQPNVSNQRIRLTATGITLSVVPGDYAVTGTAGTATVTVVSLTDEKGERLDSSEVDLIITGPPSDGAVSVTTQGVTSNLIPVVSHPLQTPTLTPGIERTADQLQLLRRRSSNAQRRR